MRRAVKYCGGCNARFDRVDLVRRLEKMLGEKLPSTQPEIEYDEVYVICGCSARCADTSAIRAKRFILIDEP